MRHCIEKHNTVQPSDSTAGIVQDPSPCAAPLAGRTLPSFGAARTIPADQPAIQHKNYTGKKTNTEPRQKIPLELRAKTCRQTSKPRQRQTNKMQVARKALHETTAETSAWTASHSTI